MLMKKFQVITNENSENCELLRSWLKKHKAKFEEWHIEDSDVKNKLLDDEKFTQKFCDIVGCSANTPVLRMDETGEYVFEGLFDGDGVIDEKAIKSIIGLK
jgi:hypothetical protein